VGIWFTECDSLWSDEKFLMLRSEEDLRFTLVRGMQNNFTCGGCFFGRFAFNLLPILLTSLYSKICAFYDCMQLPVPVAGYKTPLLVYKT